MLQLREAGVISKILKDNTEAIGKVKSCQQLGCIRHFFIFCVFLGSNFEGKRRKN